ncbi:hypothetical protein C8Q76DRAFT_247957 [Earliella scabrosa]|nr:hypothetical protein C8Q76DRAFT_247957 [Earliella scabrosa]
MERRRARATPLRLLLTFSNDRQSRPGRDDRCRRGGQLEHGHVLCPPRSPVSLKRLPSVNRHYSIVLTSCSRIPPTTVTNIHYDRVPTAVSGTYAHIRRRAARGIAIPHPTFAITSTRSISSIPLCTSGRFSGVLSAGSSGPLPRSRLDRDGFPAAAQSPDLHRMSAAAHETTTNSVRIQRLRPSTSRGDFGPLDSDSRSYIVRSCPSYPVFFGSRSGPVFFPVAAMDLYLSVQYVRLLPENSCGRCSCRWLLRAVMATEY